MNTQRRRRDIDKVLKALSDNNSLELLQRLSHETAATSYTLQQDSGLSRKQYYSRTALMIKNGIVKRNNGILRITVYGRVILNLVGLYEKASKLKYQLKAIDSLINDKSMPEGVKADMINALIVDDEIRRIINK